jgi:hypothetical protein
MRIVKTETVERVFYEYDSEEERSKHFNQFKNDDGFYPSGSYYDTPYSSGLKRVFEKVTIEPKEEIKPPDKRYHAPSGGRFSSSLQQWQDRQQQERSDDEDRERMYLRKDMERLELWKIWQKHKKLL